MNSQLFDGFGQSSGKGKKPAIIVVDFIKGFTSVECSLGSNLDNEIFATKRLLDLARGGDIPIIFTTVSYESHFMDGANFVRKVPALKELVEGSKWVDIDDRLDRKKEAEPLINKKFASAFFGTNLSSLLTHYKVDTTIIVGCSTSGCVRATAVDALQHGYHVLISEDCVGDRSKEAHIASLNDIQAKYGDVISSNETKKYLEEVLL